VLYDAGNLAFNIENKKAITDAGALPKLVEILYNGGNSLRLEAIIALGTLAHKSAENKVAIVAAGAVNPLVGLLKRSTGACCSRFRMDVFCTCPLSFPETLLSDNDAALAVQITGLKQLHCADHVSAS
jgi:hypothetical protein